MTRHRRPAAGIRPLLAAAGLAFLLSQPVLTSDSGVRGFLETAFTLGPDDFAQIDAGQVLARTLPATDPREVATLGIVRMKTTPDFYISRLTDIVNFKRDEAVLQIGVFGTPPALGDVAALTLDAADIKNLRECQVGRCGVQLPADAIDRFQREVDWRQADASQRANALMREILVEYVGRYQRTGAAASMQYADGAGTLNLGQEFRALAASEFGGWNRFPLLRSHLLEYPDLVAPDTFDRLYWSKERVGRRSVASVTHLAIARTAATSPADYAVASKQIYGTHYYDASLGLTVLLRDRASAAPATYVAYLNRSRIDIFGGVLGKLTRKVVTVKARTTVSDQLARLQRTIETQFAASNAR